MAHRWEEEGRTTVFPGARNTEKNIDTSTRFHGTCFLVVETELYKKLCKYLIRNRIIQEVIQIFNYSYILWALRRRNMEVRRVWNRGPNLFLVFNWDFSGEMESDQRPEGGLVELARNSFMALRRRLTTWREASWVVDTVDSAREEGVCRTVPGELSNCLSHSMFWRRAMGKSMEKQGSDQRIDLNAFLE